MNKKFKRRLFIWKYFLIFSNLTNILTLTFVNWMCHCWAKWLIYLYLLLLTYLKEWALAAQIRPCCQLLPVLFTPVRLPSRASCPPLWRRTPACGSTRLSLSARPSSSQTRISGTSALWVMLCITVGQFNDTVECYAHRKQEELVYSVRKRLEEALMADMLAHVEETTSEGDALKLEGNCNDDKQEV